MWKQSNWNTEVHCWRSAMSNFGLKISASISVFKSSSPSHPYSDTELFCSYTLPPSLSLALSPVSHTHTTIASTWWEEVFAQRAGGWSATCWSRAGGGRRCEVRRCSHTAGTDHTSRQAGAVLAVGLFTVWEDLLWISLSARFKVFSFWWSEEFEQRRIFSLWFSWVYFFDWTNLP